MSPNCVWSLAGDYIVCEVCGYKTKARAHKPLSYYRRCRPPVSTLARNFARDMVAHAKAGYPKATAEQMQARFEICCGCEIFARQSADRGYCRDKQCGCSMSGTSQHMNALSMADKSCPRGKWGPCNTNTQENLSPQETVSPVPDSGLSVEQSGGTPETT